jgi:hypothetical protein
LSVFRLLVGILLLVAGCSADETPTGSNEEGHGTADEQHVTVVLTGDAIEVQFMLSTCTKTLSKTVTPPHTEIVSYCNNEHEMVSASALTSEAGRVDLLLKDGSQVLRQTTVQSDYGGFGAVHWKP